MRAVLTTLLWDCHTKYVVTLLFSIILAIVLVVTLCHWKRIKRWSLVGKLVVSFFLVVCLCTLLGSVVFVVLPFSVHSSVPTLSEEPTPAKTPYVEVDTTGVDTTGWKTYTNSQQGYFLKYPSTWEIVEKDGYITFYSQGSQAFSRMTAFDKTLGMGAGMSPNVGVTISSLPFFMPRPGLVKSVTTPEGIHGYYNNSGTNPFDAQIAFPFMHNTKTLELDAYLMDQSTIDASMKSHNSHFTVEVIDAKTFQAVGKSMKFF